MTVLLMLIWARRITVDIMVGDGSANWLGSGLTCCGRLLGVECRPVSHSTAAPPHVRHHYRLQPYGILACCLLGLTFPDFDLALKQIEFL